jgi:hypothetical protein
LDNRPSGKKCVKLASRNAKGGKLKGDENRVEKPGSAYLVKGETISSKTRCSSKISSLEK